jgi:RND superfamily putative drug exporter
MTRWTHLVIRFRWPVLGLWLAVLVLGIGASSQLSNLLSNTFTVPGTDSEQVRTTLERHFGDRSDGAFTVVFKVSNADAPGLRADLAARVAHAARVIPSGKAAELRSASSTVLYQDVTTSLQLAAAKGYTYRLKAAIGSPPGVTVYVTGAASIQRDLDPIFANDLKKGESIALPIALAVLLAVFGLSWAVAIPFLFAGATIFGTLGLVYLVAHEVTIATYSTNLVQLIGLGIAVDYSLLVVYRFREELARGLDRDQAIVRTMETAGRAVVFSGGTVAIGLAMLLFIPVPFIRSIGLAGFLLPVLSIVAAVTLQPALLAVFGTRGVRKHHVSPWLRLHGLPLPELAATTDIDRGLWARLARSIMKRPAVWLAGGAAVVIAAAVPVYALQLTPGSTTGIPRYPQSMQGFDLLRTAVGPGAISPSQVLVDAGPGGNVLSPPIVAGISRLEAGLRKDREVAEVYFLPSGRFVDASGRYAQVMVAGHSDYGSRAAQAFVGRLRHDIIPGAGFPAGVKVLAGGGPPQGVDFLDRAYGSFPWLVLAVLVLTYLLLLRAFRSLLLPLKAVLLNLLSVAASYGMLVVFFRWGFGSHLGGIYQVDQIEGWIPIFLFAMLFGLSMDYEVFLVSRMRESWDDVQDNTRAVAHGLERTGRIVTAAAIVMVAAFSGFIAGSIVGLQQFGVGLAVAIFLDATVVRAILVPSLMSYFGRWNWWLPERVARIARVKASPLAPRSGLAPPAVARTDN